MSRMVSLDDAVSGEGFRHCHQDNVAGIAPSARCGAVDTFADGGEAGGDGHACLYRWRQYTSIGSVMTFVLTSVARNLLFASGNEKQIPRARESGAGNDNPRERPGCLHR